MTDARLLGKIDGLFICLTGHVVPFAAMLADWNLYR